MILDPPWASVLKDDHVTLKCQGPHPAGDNTTQWLHNGSLLSSQAPAYTITAARAEDGGEYRCQTGLSSLSDPVQLRVHLGESVQGRGTAPLTGEASGPETLGSQELMEPEQDKGIADRAAALAVHRPSADVQAPV